jgi:hypothetical protein
MYVVTMFKVVYYLLCLASHLNFQDNINVTVQHLIDGTFW